MAKIYSAGAGLEMTQNMIRYDADVVLDWSLSGKKVIMLKSGARGCMTDRPHKYEADKSQYQGRNL